MALGEILVKIADGIAGGLSHVFGRSILEGLIQALGYQVCKRFNKHIDPEGVPVFLAGFAAWGLIIAGIGYAFTFFAEQSAVASCLDAGGQYDSDTQTCDS